MNTSPTMETKVCKVCGLELPESAFMRTRFGSLTDTCRECRTAALRANKELRRIQVGGDSGNRPFSDEAFDGREPREVIELMSRAKRWLESRGYNITLKGTYTQVKEVKF